MKATDAYHLFGKYLSFPEHEASAKIIMIHSGHATVLFNYEELLHWSDNIRANPALGQDAPEYILKCVSLDDLDKELVFDTPQYRNVSLAFLDQSSKIHSVLRSSTSYTPFERDALGDYSMAKTAVFDSENNLIKVYKSGKEAKAAHKGATDVKFVSEDKFEPIGEYETKEALFPPVVKEVKEKPVAAEGDGEKATRTVIKRTGAYTIVKHDGARFAEGDERGLLHAAVMDSDTVEQYLEKAPKEAKFVSSRGADQSVSATGYLAYCFKRGWIKQGESAEPEVVVEEAQAGE